MQMVQTRRSFLAALAWPALPAVCLIAAADAAAEPPPETTTGSVPPRSDHLFCPSNMSARALLRAEGFTDIALHRYDRPSCIGGSGQRASLISIRTCRSTYASAIDRGLPITLVTGVHAGCYELFAHGDNSRHHRSEREARRSARNPPS